MPNIIGKLFSLFFFDMGERQSLRSVSEVVSGFITTENGHPAPTSGVLGITVIHHPPQLLLVITFVS